MQWRLRSNKSHCELCGHRFLLQGPLHCAAASAFALSSLALLILLMSSAHRLLVLGGFAMPTAKICQCGDFTPPYGDALNQLFEVVDEDANGALCFTEIRQLADRTGEIVSNETLRRAMNLADHNDKGITRKGLEEAYVKDTAGSVLYQDLQIYGLQFRHHVRLWPLFPTVVAGVRAAWKALPLLPLTPRRMQQKNLRLHGGILFGLLCYLQVWHCPLSAFIFNIVAWLCLWITETPPRQPNPGKIPVQVEHQHIDEDTYDRLFAMLLSSTVCSLPLLLA